jgi:hypothetical protein
VNRDFAIGVTELLRVIQLFSAGVFHCADGTEDGYSPGFGVHPDCAPHTTDNNPQDWSVSLSELLRLVQLHNAPGGKYFFPEDS